jgi:hypothetical protein
MRVAGCTAFDFRTSSCTALDSAGGPKVECFRLLERSHDLSVVPNGLRLICFLNVAGLVAFVDPSTEVE